MSDDNGRQLADDALLEKFSQVAVPHAVEVRLRARMQEFYRQSETLPLRDAALPRARRLVPFYAAGGLAAALVAVVLAVSLGSRDAWAQVKKSLRSKSWVRLTMKVPDGAQVPEGFRPPEMWYSAEKRVAARRFNNAAQFIDFARQETYDFRPENKTLWHSTTSDRENIEFGHLGQLLRLVSDGRPLPEQADSVVEIVERAERAVRDGDRRWIEFTFKCRDARQTPGDFETTIRVDPESGLPVEMKSNQRFPGAPEGGVILQVFAFDYPEAGPDDIYALGVPRAVAVVDRRRAKTRESKEIKEFLAAYGKAQNKPIEPYSTMVLVSSGGPVVSNVMRALRGRHDGERSQVEEAAFEPLQQLNREVWSKKVNIPDEFRNRWWKEKVAALPFAGPVHRGEEMLPHNAGYAVTLRDRAAHLDSPEVESTLDRLPKSGPKGTVLLRFVVSTSLGFNDCRYWIAPDQDYLVLREECHYSRGREAWRNSTTIIDKVEQSPGGRWYATEVRQGRIEKSGDDLSTDKVYVMPPTPEGFECLRIEKADGDGSGGTIFVVKPNADGSRNEARPVQTSYLRYFVDFE